MTRYTFNQPNDHTTIRHSLSQGSTDTEIPIKSRPPSPRTGPSPVEQFRRELEQTVAIFTIRMNSDTDAPLAPGDTVHIQTDDPLCVTRDGATYRAQDADEDGKPVGDPWPLSEGAVRGLLGRHDWTRVEATASVRGADDE